MAARPNRYEEGRANIVAYNWDLKKQVAVDVSGALSKGDRFEVRIAGDPYGQPVYQAYTTGRRSACRWPVRKPRRNSARLY